MNHLPLAGVAEPDDRVTPPCIDVRRDASMPANASVGRAHAALEFFWSSGRFITNKHNAMQQTSAATHTYADMCLCVEYVGAPDSCRRPDNGSFVFLVEGARQWVMRFFMKRLHCLLRPHDIRMS